MTLKRFKLKDQPAKTFWEKKLQSVTADKVIPKIKILSQVTRFLQSEFDFKFSAAGTNADTENKIVQYHGDSRKLIGKKPNKNMKTYPKTESVSFEVKLFCSFQKLF